MSFLIKKQLSNKDNAADNLNSLQDDLLIVMNQLNGSIALQMNLLTNIALTTTASAVAHNLGYECRGFIIVNKTASLDIYRDTSVSNPDSRKYIMLKTASSSGTVSLLVF